ncbi:MAG TPA: helix-turn-helix domain-containing protein [Thermomicrobiales bacterium]|nr:helix-turn-helix domain-containing protein [Thermomicrobiales bacterium]
MAQTQTRATRRATGGDSPQSEMVTLAEARRRLGISRGTSYDLVAAGKFPVPTARVGGRVLVNRAALDALIEFGDARERGGQEA